MKNYSQKAYIFIVCFIIITLLRASFMTGEDTSNSTLFSNQKRPVPVFDHALHEDSLGDEKGCAKCHHVLDPEQNQLVYAEGEEAACSECHSLNQSENILSIREANHASCTNCHRTLKKTKSPAAHTTCGECHKTLFF